MIGLVWSGLAGVVVGGCDQDVTWSIIINDETHQQPEQPLIVSNCLYQRSNSAIIISVNILRLPWDR